MSLYLGLIAASISALLWGSQFVPLKRVKNPDMLHYSFFMALGIFATSIALTFLFGFPFIINTFGVLAGITWNIGNIFYIGAVNRIGLAKGTAISLGMAMIIPFLAGIFFFNEPLNILLGVAGVITFLLGMFFATKRREKIKVDITGLAYAFLAGLFFGMPSFLFKLGNLGASEFLFAMAVGIIIMSFIVFLVKVRKVIGHQIKPALYSGIMWGIAMLSSLYAITFLGLAIGQPLTQLALLVGVLWGLFYFKEISDSEIKRKVMLGTVLLFLAGVLLTLSKVFV